MPKPKGNQNSDPPADGAPEDGVEKETSLKVAQAEGQLVGKLATMRGVSVKKLFKMRDVNDFFASRLLEEMRLEAERLKKKKD